LFDEEQRQAQAVQQERQKVLHGEVMLQHAQTFVDEHLRQQEEQMWLRQLATEQMMCEAVERERQMVAQAFRQAQQQQEAAMMDRQVAHSAVNTISEELRHARDQAEVRQCNTRMQYQRLQEVTEEYQALQQRYVLLERDATALKVVNDRQKAEMHGLWRQEEQASSPIRSYSPQQRDSARFVEALRTELREAEFECHEQRRTNQELRADLVADLRRCERDRAKLDAQNQMLLERSAKQSEEVLRLRMELNRRESELRRSTQAVGLGG